MAEPPRLRSTLLRYRFPAAVWAATGFAVLLVGQVSGWLLNRPNIFSGFGGDRFLSEWYQFDSFEYLGIASTGYAYRPGLRSNVVFFPLYPLVLRAVSTVGIDVGTAGLVVSLVAGLGAALAFWRWLEVVGVEPSARAVALAVMLLYPYAWFLYGVVYSDALFVVLVLVAFILAERDHPIAAGVLGALATATRPTGLAVIAALVVLTWERAGVLSVPPDAAGLVRRWALPVRFDRSAFRARHLGPLLSVLGVAGYMTYLGVRWGNPALWISNQTVYHPTGWATLFKRGLVGNLVHWSDPVYTLTITLQALCALGVLLLSPSVARRFGWGYGVLLLTLVAMASSFTTDFIGTGRYLNLAFPAGALIGERLARHRTRGVAWLVVSGSILLAMAFGFARSTMLT